MGLAPDLGFDDGIHARRIRSWVIGRKVVQCRLDNQGVAASLAPWVARQYCRASDHGHTREASDGRGVHTEEGHEN